jgi:aminoglycoside phosphotransferase (APT) family kinase protein
MWGNGVEIAVLGNLVATGTRSRVYTYGVGAVAKVPEPSTPDAWIIAEARFTEAVRACGAPAPRVLGLEVVAGRTAGIYEHVAGISMWQRVLQRPDRAGYYGRQLARLQAEVLSLQPPLALPRLCDRLLGKIRRAAEEVDPALHSGRTAVLADATTVSLCHGDFHPANIIMSPGGPIAVDWFDAARGDRLGDIARTLLLLNSDGDRGPSHLPGADRQTLTAVADGYRREIEQLVDIDAERLAQWYQVEMVACLGEGVARPTILRLLPGASAVAFAHG